MIATRSAYARCFGLVLMLMFAVVAFAQSRAATGDIVGRVIDPKGGAISDVTVTATNQATGFEKSATTDSEGNYHLIRLPPGSYDVKTSAPSGFAQSEISDLGVNAGGKTSLDITLSVVGKPVSREAALAKSLADELEKAGVEITEKDMDDMLQGITEGGQPAMAIAYFILAAITESESHQKSQENTSTKKPIVRLSCKQIGVLEQSLTKGENSTLKLSHYVTSKLTQLKKDCQAGKSSS